MTTFLPALKSALDIPETPDIERMRRETGARLRSAMADRGVDALILLGNNAVVYAAGVSWPLGDAGLSYVERPVAVVLADDPHPHLFLPFREGASSESGLPADHLHGPVYLEFDEGAENFARVIEELIPAAAVIAVDELTGAMRRAQARLFRSGCPVDAAQVVGAANSSRPRTRCPASERRCGSPMPRWSMCRLHWPREFGRSTCQRNSPAGLSSWARWPACWSQSGR